MSTTRQDIMQAYQTLRRAARLLELQARRARDEHDASHEQALRTARGMIRSIVHTSSCTPSDDVV